MFKRAKRISDLWIIVTPPPLPVARGICIIEYQFGTMSAITFESFEDLNYVSDIGVISSWLSSMWSTMASILFFPGMIEH